MNLLGRKILRIRVDMLRESRLVMDGGIDVRRRVVLLLINGNAGRVVIGIIFCCVTRGCCLSILLSSNLLCCEEAATGTAGTTHCVFVAAFVEIRLDGEIRVK